MGKFFRQTAVALTIFATILSSFGPLVGGWVPRAQAVGGINVMYMNDGGATPDTFLDSLTTKEAFLEIVAFDSAGGALNSITVCLDEMNSFDPATDLNGLDLYQDNGNSAFDSGTDTLLRNDALFETLTDTSYMGGSCQKAVFSGLNLAIPTTFGGLRLYVVAKPKANLDANPLRSFNPIIPTGGIDITSGGTITDWPVGMNSMFPPVKLGVEGSAGMFSPLMISEIQTAGGTTDDEYIEIYNRDPGMNLNLSMANFTIVYAAASKASGTDLNVIGNWDTALVLNSGIIPAGGFYLIGSANGSGYDYGATVAANKTFNTFNLPTTGGIIGLFSPAMPTSNLVDLVAYGNATATLAEGGQPAPAPAANGSIERKAFPDSTATKMATGGIHAGKGNREDSNNNAMDFVLRATADPQNTSSAAELAEGGAGGAGTPVVINEIFYNTATGQGWIELYNRAGSPQDISGWKIKSNGKIYTVPAGKTINNGAFAVVHWKAAGTDTATDYYTSNSNGTTVDADLGVYGGDVVLSLADNTIKDYVEYGGAGFANETNASTNGQWTTGDFVPNSLYDQSIGRRYMNGDDFNGSNDWQFFSTTSAGFSNMGGDSNAPTAVTGVTLSDTDLTANSGLNGNDIHIVWTPSTAPDPSFDRYAIYLLPAATAFNDAVHIPIDQIFGGQYQYSGGTPQATFTYNGSGFIIKDSAGGNLADGSYKVYVIGIDFAGNRSGTAMSAAGTLTGEVYSAGSDATKPFIMHMGVGQAKAGADIVLLARFVDDRALAAGADKAQVIYKVNAGAWQAPVNCAAIESDYYTCTISGGALADGDTVSYYLKAKDGATTTPNAGFFSASPAADMSGVENDVKASPFVINILAADGDTLGDYTDTDSDADLSGTVAKSDGGIFADGQQPKVFLEGTGVGIVTPSNGTGAFTFADNTLAPGSYNVVAFKDGYMDMFMNVFKGNSGINIRLNQGTVNMMKGGGMDKPFVTWTAPGDGMMGVPTNIYCTGDCSTIGAGEMPVIIGFDRPMNSNTINDQDASNAGSNIYLTINGQDRVAGKVYYNSVNNEARFYATAQNSLTPGTQYSIIVTQGVTDTNGNPIASGMTSDGSFSNSFTTKMNMDNFMTGAGFTDIKSGYGQGGMMMPPYIMGTTPQSGAFQVKINRSVVIQFSEAMDTSSISAGTIKLFPVTSESPWIVGSTAITATVSLDQATQKIVTLDPADNLPTNSANHGWYVLKVMGSAKSATGVWLGNPSGCGTTNPDTCLLAQTAYESKFQADTNDATKLDAAAPTVVGANPKNNDGITVGTPAVSVGIAALEVGFSESMAPSTITAQSITLKVGASSVTGKVKYDPIGNIAKFIPNNALTPNTQYTLTVSTSVTDLANQALVSDYTINFKTGGADTTSPTVLFANGDEFMMTVSYSKPMNYAKQTDAAKWTTSVLNPANYFIKTLTGGAGAAPYNSITSLSGISGLNFNYDEYSNTVTIEGLMLRQGGTPSDYQIFVDSVTDKSNNIVSNTGGRVVPAANAAQGPIKNSATTFGMLGPGGPGMMMMGPMGGSAAAGPGIDMGNMGMMKSGVFPMNAMAGQTSMYFVDVPITQSIPAGGTIKLTFPSGFSVGNVIKDPFSPINNDINEWNAGTVTFTVNGDTMSRVITITTGGAATQTNDFLHLDLKGIVNSSIPKEFGTDGYTVDIKTFSGTGALLETVTSMPFFITQGGNYTLSGTITMRNGNNTAGVNIDAGQTMSLFLGSPMTGPMETTVTFTGGTNTADYSFTGLSEGEYHFFTDPNITLNVGAAAKDFNGMMMPEPTRINATTDGNADYVIDKDLTITQLDSTSGTAVTVILQGNFSTGGANDNVDIFANSPGGFRVKTVTPGNDGVNATTPQNYTIYLPNGDWMVGIGPAMPKGPMSGPPKMPDWMPPMPNSVKIAGSPVSVSINISTQVSKTITGKVTDGVPTQSYPDGTPIQDAEIFAYQPMGGFGGSNTKTAVNGNFTLKIPVLGTYMVGAFKPGLPGVKESSVDVRNDGNYVNGSVITSLIIKMKKPAYQISGQVLNASSKPVSYAPVWAYQTAGTGMGGANTMTDSSGNYILYVDNGVWRVEGDAPGVGWMQYELPITINGADQSNIILKPDTNTTWVSIGGTITINSAPQANVPVRAVSYDANGNFLGKQYGGMTNSTGVYSISVPGISGGGYKYYRVDTWTPDYGEVELSSDGVLASPANIKMQTSNVSNADITIAALSLNTATISFGANKADYSAREAFINIDGVTFSGSISKPNGFHKSLRVADISGANPTVSLKAGDYQFFVDVPGYGNYIPDNSGAFDSTKKAITIDGAGDNITFTLPDLDNALTMITIDGAVSGPASGQRDAWVWIGNPQSGFHAGQQANATTGAYSMKVPKLSSGNYMIGSEKQGYISGEPTSNSGTADATINFTLTAQTATISGYIFADRVGGTADAYESGEGLPNGWISAENTITGAKANAPIDGIGHYTLGVTNGSWKVYGAADGYSKNQYSVNGIPTTITVPAVGDKNIELAVDNNWANKTKTSPMTPASGGVIDDTAQDTGTGKASGTGVKLTVPPNALGSSSSSGNVSAKETAAVAATDSMKPIGDSGKTITATDNSGQPITTLDNYIDVEIVTYKADIEAAGNITDEAKLKTAKIGYWDDTLNEWVNLPTTKTAYYKDNADTEWTMYNGTDTESGFVKFIDDALSASATFIAGTNYDDYKIVAKASTNHLTVFALGTSPDGVRPAAPANFIQSAGTGTSVGLSWNAVTTNADSSAITDLYGYAVYRSTDGTTYSQVNTSAILAGTQTYADSTTSAWTSYYYKVTAGDDDDLESAYSSALQVCSNKTVSNGTVAASCAITCDTGYTLSGNSCASSSNNTGGGYMPVTTPPTNTSISIASGAANTLARGVTLTLAATGATQMAISNTADFAGVNWETYATSKTWTLTEGDGVKTVYAKFRDADGDTATTVSDTIILGASVGAPETSTTPASSAITSAYPNGTLIKSDSAPEIYVIKDGKRVWIPNANAFIKGGYKWENVKTVTGEIVKQVGSATLIRVAGDPRVYAIVNNAKRHIKSSDEFNSKGYKWTDIVTVGAAELEAYPEEGAITVGGKTIIITASSLRIRSSNSTKGKALGWVKKNDNYSVLEENNGWYKITSKAGITGWVSGEYATVNATETIAAPASTNVSASLGNIVITSARLRIRNVSSVKGKVLGHVNKGEAYQVLEETNGWYKIKTKDAKVGWVSGEYAVKQ